jgi:hypothetical protein
MICAELPITGSELTRQAHNGFVVVFPAFELMFGATTSQ